MGGGGHKESCLGRVSFQSSETKEEMAVQCECTRGIMLSNGLNGQCNVTYNLP